MSDHCAVLFDVNVTAKRQRKPDRYVYQYKKDKENRTDMSTNAKKTKRSGFLCLFCIGRHIDLVFFVFLLSHSHQTILRNGRSYMGESACQK
jgi:hypothetical protein